ncbi:MAG: Csm3 family CRISPR-associated RAMP protein [candidate division TA06 bacterium 32_111]|uniref:CRISPR system Cms endoribonuclease Csm3 n=1 Tax=candidate division WOR-3 bacterium TaxID=2052148 RepID=A0A348MLJ7_UNCW3|nr:MAG: Csm3 family CRISPR-associated RAMP protein [candidate division TA06 bacterium 32_111]HAF07923.1 type III-A CRISPR-associated RAMP protein Csm3 [candidate division WOR-3 bacterium]HCP16375.1 type III-A CRISPR-associated RAMP protein Csm3 [candidate division WOR-3 bacterium]
MKLIKKVFIEGKIQLLTGLHIGGSSTAFDIGGIDSNVIKTSNGIPYIPGSSIKGKMRSLMEMKMSKFTQETGKVDSNNKENSSKEIQNIFGSMAGGNTITRLIVRDSFLDKETLEAMIEKEGEFNQLELEYTEVKWENTIDRLTAKANPRQLERIPAGAKFDFSFVFTMYDENDKSLLKYLFEAMMLLEDDYLGGSGTRGYGRICFKDIKVSEKTAKDYEEIKPEKLLKYEAPTLKELVKLVVNYEDK